MGNRPGSFLWRLSFWLFKQMWQVTQVDPLITVAVLTGVFSVATSVIGASANTKRLMTELADKTGDRLTRIEAQLEIKLDPMYEFFVVGAMERAHQAGLAQKQSPMRTTKAWHELFPDDLRREIHQDIARRMSAGRSFTTMEVMAPYKDALLELAIASEYSVEALLGAVEVHVRTELRKGSDPGDCVDE